MSVIIKSLPDRVNLTGLHHSNPEHYPYLLETVSLTGSDGNYSILFAFPQELINCQSHEDADTFFIELEKAWQQHSQSIKCGLPFCGGWFVYLGYESLHGIEPGVTCHSFPYDFPVAFAARCPAAVIYDHLEEQTYIVAESKHEALADEILGNIENIEKKTETTISIDSIHEEDPNQFLQGVERIHDYVSAGDVFQVNLSRAWTADISGNDRGLALYQRLSKSNPAPFACLIHHDQGDIISSSPERLVRSKDGWVETRPIAGTRPRTQDAENQRWLAELKTDIKEHAEHIMLIDLERNDLGRVCEAGSIEVDELMTLESYEYVHHIVSNIRGKLRQGASPVDVLKAVFPGGTITGCPKVRCMEIIAELEQQGRGPYTGSVGYINHDGSMDFNILIRTLFLQGSSIHFRAGAGIVHDSIDINELKETRHKARGLLAALEEQG